jgi:hypothetical protein
MLPRPGAREAIPPTDTGLAPEVFSVGGAPAGGPRVARSWQRTYRAPGLTGNRSSHHRWAARHFIIINPDQTIAWPSLTALPHPPPTTIPELSPHEVGWDVLLDHVEETPKLGGAMARHALT